MISSLKMISVWTFFGRLGDLSSEHTPSSPQSVTWYMAVPMALTCKHKVEEKHHNLHKSRTLMIISKWNPHSNTFWRIYDLLASPCQCHGPYTKISSERHMAPTLQGTEAQGEEKHCVHMNVWPGYEIYMHYGFIKLQSYFKLVLISSAWEWVELKKVWGKTDH